MKTRPSTTDHPSSRHEARIDPRVDAVLGLYAHAEPSPGLEARVAARLASARPSSRFQFSVARTSAWLVLRRISAGALATAAGAAIVVGTIQHSERSLPPQISRHGHSSGLTPATAGHIPTKAMPQGGSIDPSAPRPAPHGRATVSRDQPRHATGAVVPRSPYAPNEQPGSKP
jgi:hypothetical protein